jgi:hypothetical protein
MPPRSVLARGNNVAALLVSILDMRYILLAMGVFLLGAGGFGTWAATRERPQLLITGDYSAAVKTAGKSGARLVLVVDRSPPFL